MKVQFNKEKLQDKIYGCWIGKNIGGTMGAPFECEKNMLDIDGFTTRKGEPVPNDDLDLQLVWIKALRQAGPHMMDSNVLGEYWLTHIHPHWNEYGTGKMNLVSGLLAPMSGEFKNEDWKHSNGAWIRSEVWACLAPGFPNVAIKYALMDATIDHGLAEGTVGEIFTAALESIAFFEDDIRTIIEKALSFIPAESRVAQCVRLVLREYDNKTNYREVREMLVKETADLGWFQAPANIAYAVIGLMYGEGDMKKSLIYAINCGDDTDCTAATCGAVLGILLGAKAIPEELKEYIGDRIVTCSINGSYPYEIPKTCTELTEQVMEVLPGLLACNKITAEYTGGEDVYNKEEAWGVLEGYAQAYYKRSPYSFEVKFGYFLKALVEYDKEPVIAPGEEIKVNVTLFHEYGQQVRADLHMMMPEGFTSDCPKQHAIHYKFDRFEPQKVSTFAFTITAGEQVEARNNLYLAMIHNQNPRPMVIPITLLGA